MSSVNAGTAKDVDECVKCPHKITDFSMHFDDNSCSCGCHADLVNALNEFLISGGTRETFQKEITKLVDHRRMVDRILSTGLFKTY